MLTTVRGVDVTALCAHIREEGTRTDVAAGPGDASGKDQLGGRPFTEKSSRKSSTPDAVTVAGTPEAGSAGIPPSWSAGASLRLDGQAVDVQLRVQLPFWLLMPNCELTAKYRESSLKVCVSGDAVEIRADRLPAAGTLHFTPGAHPPSQMARGMVPDMGRDTPSARLASQLRQVVVPGASSDAIFRSTRTVLTIHTKAIEDCLCAITEGGRRTLDASMYFQCLVHAAYSVRKRRH